MTKKVRNVTRQNTAREKAWKLMRLMGNYTLGEIATLIEADVENIRHYHQCLVHAGYVRQVGTKRQEGRPGFDKVFRLVKNTGPKPPVQKDLRFIFDPNNGEYWAEDPERVACVIVGAIPSGRPVLEPDSGRGTASPLQGITGKIKLGSGQKLLCPRKNSPLKKGDEGGCHVD